MPTVELRHFPRDDQDFRDHVRGHIDRRQHASDHDMLMAVQTAVRARYPDAVLRQQELLADLGFSEAHVTWYAYRDGTPIPWR